MIGNDPDRQMIFKNPSADAANNVSAAPYLRRLGDDETIASWQGNYGRNGVGEGYFDMFVAVGDKDARNFQCITEPFGLSTNAHSLWNSVSYIRGDNSVMAIGSIGDDKTGNAINMIKVSIISVADAILSQQQTPTRSLRRLVRLPGFR